MSRDSKIDSMPPTVMGHRKLLERKRVIAYGPDPDHEYAVSFVELIKKMFPDGRVTVHKSKSGTVVKRALTHSEIDRKLNDFF